MRGIFWFSIALKFFALLRSPNPCWGIPVLEEVWVKCHTDLKLTLPFFLVEESIPELGLGQSKGEFAFHLFVAAQNYLCLEH